ncbi:LETM1-related biofilm-associated protein [Eudoraea chungangensis]|uniref:LETM1-related biofilm-associated protein n=1 Tax=Eudoraea chungangensis TaxID=1481905 RepID=UPI0023EDAA8B|nr:LETM1-related biofilm-associated protein [Eudoraea chungangensis]
MNPSAIGWIDKFGYLVKDSQDVFKDFWDLYGGLKKAGFVYGLNVKIPRFITPEHVLSEDEKAKINLVTALYFTYKLEKGEEEFDVFLKEVFGFYKELNVSSLSLYQKIFSGNKISSRLESLIDSRVFLEANILTKTFNSNITNSLLFIDVLTFKYFLRGGKKLTDHAKRLEYLTINITYHALSSKQKNKTDERLAHLFATSLSFIDSEQKDFDGAYRKKLLNNTMVWENKYFLDVACLAIWEDNKMDSQESLFIHSLGKDLGFTSKEVNRSLEEINSFFTKNVSTIRFLKDSNLAIQFYDGMAVLVNRLIIRNNKRLQKELSDSKELVLLLSKSTRKELSIEEKKKVQNQLLDIFKSIPSLAIFLLPGGAVLLPIFIKLIPKLLPSAFDDNRVENSE